MADTALAHERKCKKCGCTVFVKNGKSVRCKECQKRLVAEYVSRNLDKVKERSAKWHEKNKAKNNARSAAYHVLNAEKIRERHKQWSKDNPEHCCRNSHNRRAKKLSIGGVLSNNLSEKLLILQKGRCACCRDQLKKYHLDHIMPLALNGSNTDDNMQLLCPVCNHQKHAKHPIEFMQSKGYLL